MGGKTGTAQVRRISKAERETGIRKGEDISWRLRDHALFVGFALFKIRNMLCLWWSSMVVAGQKQPPRLPKMC